MDIVIEFIVFAVWILMAIGWGEFITSFIADFLIRKEVELSDVLITFILLILMSIFGFWLSIQVVLQAVS